MFKPRYGYRSPITHRYRGNSKGCPIFSNLDEITSSMVEDHDECLECLAKLKNRIDIYRNLADNNKPSNTVIKSLQKLSSSSINNRLKTCLQFLIIKVNENSLESGKRQTHEFNQEISNNSHHTIDSMVTLNRVIQSNRRNRFVSTIKDNCHVTGAVVSILNTHETNQRSPSQELVSSTQDHVNTSELEFDQFRYQWQQNIGCPLIDSSQSNYDPDSKTDDYSIFKGKSRDCATSTDDKHSTLVGSSHQIDCISVSNQICNKSNQIISSFNNKNDSLPIIETTLCPDSSRRSRDETDDSMQSWIGSTQPSSITSISSSSPESSLDSATSSMCCKGTCSCREMILRTPENHTKPVDEDIKRPKLKLSEEKLRKIMDRPICFKRSIHKKNNTNSDIKRNQNVIIDTTIKQPSSICKNISHVFKAPPNFFNKLVYINSINQKSAFDLETTKSNVYSLPKLPLSLDSALISESISVPWRNHKQPNPQSTKSTINIAAIQSRSNASDNVNIDARSNAELLNCAICGIREKSSNTINCFGPTSCPICAKYFLTFLNNPQELFCAQDGDCLMTFDSRCQACWIKICLQKFTLTPEQQQKINLNLYSPKLLSTPSISLL